MLTFLTFFACSSAPPVADCPDCPDCPETEVGVEVDDWEQEVIEPILETLRTGITPWGEESFGICKGIQRCDEFVGTDVGELPEGDHVIFAELRVPKLGEEWKVNFHWECTTETRAGNTASQDHDKSYVVRHSGPNRGFRLLPLWRVKSPHTQGARECSYSLTPMRPDGQEGEAMTGSYSTLAPPE
jgi:hypothetical protein